MKMQPHVKSFIRSIIFNTIMWGFIFGSFSSLYFDYYG